MSKNIFIFLEIFGLEGGIQSYVKDILEAYTKLDSPTPAEIFLLRDEIDCNNPFADRQLFKFHYLKTLPPWRGRLKLATTLFLSLLSQKPNRIYCGHIKLASLIELYAKIFRIPYTVLTYGKEVWTRLPPSERRALQKADCIWTISRYSRDRLIDANEISPELVKILPCAINGNIFTPGEKSKLLLAKYGLEGAKVLMTVARLWSGDIYKGVDVTIRALPDIAKVIPEVKYLVIGRGDDRPRLEKLAQDLNVGDRVIFAGFVPTAELPDHYRTADAYIMPSQEGFGIVYLEAMACGLPVLAGAADGSADPLQDGRLGWQVPHRDPQAVAQACIEILQGGDRRCDGLWLREESLAEFGKDALAKILRAFF
jgi:glycosyltransferase involved in cell wall biosynthesis